MSHPPFDPRGMYAALIAPAQRGKPIFGTVQEILARRDPAIYRHLQITPKQAAVLSLIEDDKPQVTIWTSGAGGGG